MYPNKLVHLSYLKNGSYAIRDFKNPEIRGKNVFKDILPYIKWKKDAISSDLVSIKNVEYWRARLKQLYNQQFNKNQYVKNSFEQKLLNSSTSAKPKKHTKILCKVENIFLENYPRHKVFLGSHRGRSYGKYYRDAEIESKRTYYSLKMYKTYPPRGGSNVKDPDCIIVKNDIVKFVIEIKWGYLEDFPNESTDLKSIFEEKELNEINDSIKYSKCCRVRGPYIENGNEVEIQYYEKNFRVDSKTQYLVITDIKGLMIHRKKDINNIRSQYQSYRNLFTICDIKEDTNDFPGLESFIKLHKESY